MIEAETAWETWCLTKEMTESDLWSVLHKECKKHFEKGFEEGQKSEREKDWNGWKLSKDDTCPSKDGEYELIAMEMSGEVQLTRVQFSTDDGWQTGNNWNPIAWREIEDEKEVKKRSEIVPIDDKSQFERVALGEDNKPYCLIHGAMNRVSKDGLYRCLRACDHEVNISGRVLKAKRDCFAGCKLIEPCGTHTINKGTKDKGGI